MTRDQVAQLITMIRSDPTRARDWQALSLCDAAEALQAEVDAIVKVVEPSVASTGPSNG